MSNQIDKAFVQQYKNNLRHLAQQKGSMLIPTVRTESVVGKYHHFERLGATSSAQKVVRHSATTYTDAKHSRRRCGLSDYFVADMIDDEDKVRMLIDPTSPYAEHQAWELGRQMDEVVIEAALGNADSIDADDSASTVALPSSQIIDEDFGTANSNLTLAKLIESRRILDGHAGGFREELVLACNSSAVAALLGDSTITSADYNTVKALMAGEINTFMGYKFVKLANGILQGTADGTDTDPVKCIAYAPSGIGVGVGRDIKVTIDRLPMMHNSTQVYSCMTMGAVRVEDEKVVSIECVQAA